MRALMGRLVLMSGVWAMSLGGCVLQISPDGSSAGRPNGGGQVGTTEAGRPNSTQPNITTDQGSSTGQPDSSTQTPELVPLAGSLLEKVQNDPDLSRFSEVLVKSGLQDELRTKSRRTLFAPTNAAFNALSKKELEDMLADPVALKKVVHNHLLPKVLRHGQLDMGDAHRSLAGAPVEFGVGPRGVMMVVSGGGGGVRGSYDVKATNGILHQLSGVLTLPESTLMESIRLDAELSVFGQACAKAGLETMLMKDTSLTVFAPTNAAFKALETRMGSTAYNALMQDSTRLSVMVKSHLHAGLRSSNSFGTEEVLNSLEPGAHLVFTSDGGFQWVKINGREFARGGDITATNGFLHRMEGTLHDGPRE